METTDNSNNSNQEHNTGKLTLPNMIREIIFFYIKHYYNKYLNENNFTKLNEQHLDIFINKYYLNKEEAKKIRQYIRNSLKNNLGDNYNSIATENILLDIFNDTEMGKQRLKIEIEEYQKKQKDDK